MNSIKIYSRRLKEATASLNLFAPSALGPLVLGQTILCKLARNSPPAYHTRDKLGCCTISYRNINAFFSRHFLGNFFANLKLSFNRGNPTSLLNPYLTKLYRLFVLSCHYLRNKKLNTEDEMIKRCKDCGYYPGDCGYWDMRQRKRENATYVTEQTKHNCADFKVTK